jgi:hypothetical protein
VSRRFVRGAAVPIMVAALLGWSAQYDAASATGTAKPKIYNPPAAASTRPTHPAGSTVPEPSPGSYFTLFDFTSKGALIVFDGFTVSIKERGSRMIVPIGTLPAGFKRATDPAFVAVSPDDRHVLLGAGAGGSRYPDPAFNGTVFEMSLTDGSVRVVGRYPFSVGGIYLTNDVFLMGEGETFGTFTGSVEVLDISSGTHWSLIGPIPGDPGGIALDRNGNLLLGLGAGQDTQRTGEIRQFPRALIRAGLTMRRAIDFDTSGRVVNRVLNAGDLVVDATGQLYVGGGDFVGRQDHGYIGQVDLQSGRLVRTFDPVDGDPTDGDQRSFNIALVESKCELVALDLFSFSNQDPSLLYESRACRPKPHS